MTRLLGLAVFALLVIGCYTLQPVRGAVPEVGTQVAFDVNDAGRVALGGSMGPEIAQIEGRLVSKEEADYVIAVSTIRFLRGGEQVWGGEQVRLKSEYLGPAYVRRFAAGRSAVVGGTVVGGFTAFLIGRALRGAGNGDEGGRGRDTAQASRGRP